MNSDPQNPLDRDQNARQAAFNRSLTNQTPTAEGINRIEHLRDVARTFGGVLFAVCPDTRERSLALTHLEDAVMWAVKSIVLEEP